MLIFEIMPTIRIMPLDVEIESSPDTTIMDAARSHGYYWPTTCGGEGRCTTCACEVIEGSLALSPMGRAEERTLLSERGPGVLHTKTRLACQARLDHGTITVLKPGVRPAEG